MPIFFLGLKHSMFRDQEEKRHDNIPLIAECAHNNGLSAYSAIEDVFVIFAPQVIGVRGNIPSQRINGIQEHCSCNRHDPCITFQTEREDPESQNRKKERLVQKQLEYVAINASARSPD